MKRSEMVELMFQYIAFGQYDYVVDSRETMSELLTKMEEAGMLPPETLIETPYNPSYYDNVWDHESNN